MKEKFVVTVGRTFGSGGREIGRKIAEALGVNFYDKRLLSEAAQRAGLAEDLFKRADERAPSFLSGLLSFNMGVGPNTTWMGGNSYISDDNIYMAQSRFIEQITSEESCVIVGRTADHVLRNHPHALHIFIHASNDDDVAGRIMSRKDARSHGEAMTLARKVNHIRADYYNFYTDKKWGDSSSYDLTFDSSRIAADKIVEIVRGLV